MKEMKSFSQLGIQQINNGFEGEKIKIERVLNKQVVILDFKIEPSKFPDKNEKCLHLQISVDNQKRVIFCTGVALQTALKQIPKEEFPFSTTIVKENMRYQFT